MSGSFGSAGGDRQRDVQARAAARGRPRRCSRRSTAPASSPGAVTAVMASQLEPVAFDLRCPRLRPGPGIRRGRAGFVALTGAVRVHAPKRSRAQTANARRLIAASAQRIVSGLGRGPTRGCGHAGRRLGGAGHDRQGRAGCRRRLRRFCLARRGGFSESAERSSLVGRAGVGAGLVRVDADVAETVRMRSTGCAQVRSVGNVVVLRAESAVKERSRRVGSAPDTAGLVTQP